MLSEWSTAHCKHQYIKFCVVIIKIITHFVIIFFIIQQLQSKITQIDKNGYYLTKIVLRSLQSLFYLSNWKHILYILAIIIQTCQSGKCIITGANRYMFVCIQTNADFNLTAIKLWLCHVGVSCTLCPCAFPTTILKVNLEMKIFLPYSFRVNGKLNDGSKIIIKDIFTYTLLTFVFFPSGLGIPRLNPS